MVVAGRDRAGLSDVSCESSLAAQVMPISDSGGIRIVRRKSIGAVVVSNGMMQIEVSTHERDVLLRGLRYVRSSIMLELREPTKDDTYRRSMDLDEIQMLCQRLESSDPQLAAGL